VKVLPKSSCKFSNVYFQSMSLHLRNWRISVPWELKNDYHIHKYDVKVWYIFIINSKTKMPLWLRGHTQPFSLLKLNKLISQNKNTSFVLFFVRLTYSTVRMIGWSCVICNDNSTLVFPLIIKVSNLQNGAENFIY